MTVLAKQSMMHPLALWVQVVQHHISIARVACRKNNNLEVLRQVFKYFDCIGTNIDACLYHLASWKSHWQSNIVGSIQSIVAMNQSLIQIENYRLTVYMHIMLLS